MTLSVTDVLHRSFTFGRPPRVVSLVPSVTETLFDIGAGEDVVGITDFCIFPPDLTCPRLGGTKNPKIARIRALAPDLVYVNVEENLRRHADQIATFAPVFATEPKSVDDVEALITTLGAIHDRPLQTSMWIDSLREARAGVAKARPFTFACPIWKAPWMWCGGGTYVSRLVEAAGGRNVLAASSRYPALEVDDVLSMRPDVVFLPDEPFAFTDDDRPIFHGTQVIGPFPGHLFTWHGTRTVQGLRFLREAL